jgi:DNA-binding response OmpR family regulator
MSTRLSERQIILVIEDYGDSRQMLKLLLEAEGYRVLTAANGDEALELVRTQTVDLILTDFGLPGMDGMKLVRRLRKLSSPIDSVPIIMLTALESEEYSQAAIRAGCSGFLGKPVDLEKLLVMIEQLLKESAGAEPARNDNAPIRHPKS